MKHYIAFLALLLLCYCKQPARKPAPAISYRVEGSGDTALVFVHGWNINGNYWQSQVDYFKNRYKVITLDLQGHGQSPAAQPAPGIEQHANDVATLINYLDLSKVALIGHSMSGNVVLRVYQQMPEKVIALVGVDNLFDVGREPAAAEVAEVRSFFDTLRKDYRNMVQQFSAKYLFHPQTDSLVKQRVIRDMANANPATAVPCLESLSQEYKAERTILPTLRIPLRLIAAQAQLSDTIASLKKYCGKGYQHWFIPNCGHYPMIEQPALFNKFLEEAVTGRKP
jgi:pimeloyl-ACP methyl ester carboxylesterase